MSIWANPVLKSVRNARCTWRVIHNAKWLNASAAEDASIPLELLSAGFPCCSSLPWYQPGMPALQLSSLFVLDSLQWCHSVGRSRGCMSVCASAVQLGWGLGCGCAFSFFPSLFKELKMPDWSFLEWCVVSVAWWLPLRPADMCIGQGPCVQLYSTSAKNERKAI